MDFFLWRHANAAAGASDFERELSPLGHQQAGKAAEWLRQHAPAGLRIFVSPAVRARQTVAHFCDDENNIQLCTPLYENSSPNEILTMLGWPDISSPVLIVGHQPMMGILAGRLLADTPCPASFRTGALWWLRFEKGGQNQLMNVLEP